MPFTDSQLTEAHQSLGGSFFAYDLDAMADHLRALNTGAFRLWYACKANPLSHIIRTIRDAGIHCDVASLGELEQVLRSGIPGQHILLTGPAKSDPFLESAVRAGVRTVVAESPAQLVRLNRIAAKMDAKLDVLIRLQLSWDSGNSVLGGSKTTVFGLDPESWGTLPTYSHLNYRGVHAFQWGNVLEAESLSEIWLRIAKVARAFSQDQGFALEVLDLGGGLGISYENPKLRINWSEVEALAPQIREISGAKELWLELGRYAVGPFGTYVTEVMERKSVRGKDFLVCSGGSQHIARPALVGESFPAKSLKAENGKCSPVAVHGPLCTALDHLGNYSLPGDLGPGDLIAFQQTGAYGFTESMPFFLCHDLPGEIILRSGEWAVARGIESATFWLR